MKKWRDVDLLCWFLQHPPACILRTVVEEHFFEGEKKQRLWYGKKTELLQLAVSPISPESVLELNGLELFKVKYRWQRIEEEFLVL